MKTIINIVYPALLRSSALALGCVVFCGISQAVVPPPDGGYPNFNTAEGAFSLLSLTTGSGNTALGGRALQSNTTASDSTAVGYGALFDNNASLNTAIGFDALFSNRFGGFNTATGARALYRNMGGAYNTANGAGALFSNTGPGPGCGGESCGSRNTAVGAVALFSNQGGDSNTAVGTDALFYNTSGSRDTAIGDSALLNNTGRDNTAVGWLALRSNTDGELNTAVGDQVLANNTTGSLNTAVGYGALESNNGNNNVALGTGAGLDLTGNNNVALGTNAGVDLTAGDNNIDIGNSGVAGEGNTIRIGTEGIQSITYIAGIVDTSLDNGVPVVVDTSTGQLGVLPSSQRFKAEIKPMDKASEAILALRPVTFCYESSNTGAPQFGLIAEEVAKVNPDLVVRDKEGKPYSVRYDQVNAMLLNEFLTEHRKVEQLTNDFHATIARQQKQIEELAAGLQRVSAQLAAASPSLVDLK